MARPYTMSKFATPQDRINAIMAAADLSEPERMKYIWFSMSSEDQERIKEISSQLFYCILSVIDGQRF